MIGFYRADGWTALRELVRIAACSATRHRLSCAVCSYNYPNRTQEETHMEEEKRQGQWSSPPLTKKPYRTPNVVSTPNPARSLEIRLRALIQDVEREPTGRKGYEDDALVMALRTALCIHLARIQPRGSR